MDMLETLRGLAIPATLVLTGAFLFYRWLLPKPIPGIPYNAEATKSIFGDLPSVTKHLETSQASTDWLMSHNTRHNSPIVQIFMDLFSKPWVVITDYREAQDILMRRTKEFDKPDMISDLFYGINPHHHTVQPTNDAWRYQRKLMQDLMSPSFLYGVAAPQIHASFMDLVRLLAEKERLSQGRPFSVKQDIYETALEAIWAAVFGIENTATVTRTQIDLLAPLQSVDLPPPDKAVEFPRAPAPAEFHAVLEITEGLEHVVKSPYPRITGFYRRYLPSVSRQLSLIQRLMSDEIAKSEKRMQASSGSADKITNAVDHMLRREKIGAEKQRRAPQYQSKVMAAELFGLLIAGHDTTSTTLLWSLKHLTAHPQIQSKLRTELHKIFPAALAARRAPSAAEIVASITATAHSSSSSSSYSPYLDACIEELIRCSRTAGFITRTATVDAVVLGRVVPKGTKIAFCTDAGGTLEPAYDIPDSLRNSTYLAASSEKKVPEWESSRIGVFDPERWLVRREGGGGGGGEKVFDAGAGPHIVFGAGPRGCFGRKLAYLELRLAIVLVVWHFEMRGVEGEYASWDAVDQLTHNPIRTYVRLAKVGF
ncbi:cytochrome P450 [Phaeosphaeriaceae sp. PMI808]|nr:cytochrome P450 [Phaeosphaeriaceae sp. PMI808]